MTSRRSTQGWWTRRAEQRQTLQLVPPAPRMVGPMPFYPLPTPQLLPKPVVPSNETTAKPTRMDKFTSIEKRLLDKTTHVLAKSSGEYGYALKLVKRGYFKAVYVNAKHMTTFTITSAGERARAGMSLLKTVQGKQGIASGAQFGHAVAAATA